MRPRPTATTPTRYVDFSAPDGLTPGIRLPRRPSPSPRSFDRTHDTTMQPAATVRSVEGLVTNAFYTVNWLHDYWYDSGFDEAAGNAQLSNYGRGGVGRRSDARRAAGQLLGGSRNNANMTHAVRRHPRRACRCSPGSDRRRDADAARRGGNVAVGTAAFGAVAISTSRRLVALANDGVGAATDALPAARRHVHGQIALVDRGTCNFTGQGARTRRRPARSASSSPNNVVAACAAGSGRHRSAGR